MKKLSDEISKMQICFSLELYINILHPFFQTGFYFWKNSFAIIFPKEIDYLKRSFQF